MHHDFLCYNYSLEKPFVFVIVCVLEFSLANERALQWYSFFVEKLAGRCRSSRDYLLYFKQVAKTGNAITNMDDKTSASICRKHKLKNVHIHDLEQYKYCSNKQHNCHDYQTIDRSLSKQWSMSFQTCYEQGTI